MGMGTVRVCSRAVLVYHGSNSEVYIPEPAGVYYHSQTISSQEALTLCQQTCHVYISACTVLSLQYSRQGAI